MVDYNAIRHVSNSPGGFSQGFKIPSIARRIKQKRLMEEYKENPYEALTMIFDETADMFANDIDKADTLGRIADIDYVIENLRAFYLEGKVGSIEGLPLPDEIHCLDYNGLETLIAHLRQNYFPTEESFELSE